MTSHNKDDRARLLDRAIGLKKAAARSQAATLPARRPDQLPRLGEMQRSLWILHRMNPTSTAYNLASAFRLSGPVDLGALERGFDTIIARHRILRSTFVAHEDTALQIVHPHTPARVEVVEAIPGGSLETAADQARRPFDLETGPLVRMILIEDRSTRECVLLLSVHHILADERSLNLLWKEIAEAYSDRLTVPVPAVQFDDYVAWATANARTTRAQDLDFWRHRLDPLPDDLVLPFETSTGSSASPRGCLLRRTLNPILRQDIRQLATTLGTTPFVVYAFAFRLLLSRYLPGRHTTFGTPVSTRSHPAAADMLGYFLNPMVIATSRDEGVPLRVDLREFAREIRERLSHVSVPFDQLAEHLAPTRRWDRHPIFQVMFVYQETGQPPTLGGVRLEPVALDLGTSKFDLTLLVSEQENSLDIAVEYRADRFDAVWMRGVLGHYDTLLKHLGDDLDRPTADVPMLTPEEESRLSTEWQGVTTGAAEVALLPQQIRAQMQRSPDACAVTCVGAHSSYAELEQAAAAVARQLLAEGVKAGDRVGLFLDRTPLLLSSLLGTHWTGAAYVPLDPDYPSARNRDVLGDADVAAILTTTRLRDQLDAGRRVTITVDALARAASPEVTPSALSPDTPAYLLYTSGSSGHPKGVVVTHGNLRASTAARLAVYDTAPKRFLLVPSVAFDSSVAGIFWTLSSGGTLIVPTADQIGDPRRLAEFVAEQRVTMLLCVPTLYHEMLMSGGSHLRTLTTAIVAGEPCSQQLVRDHFRVAPGTRLFNEYGPTETTVWATAYEVTADDAERPVAIGRPIPSVQIHVLDPLGRKVPAGIPGEGWIAGPTVAMGYWNKQDLTDEHFVVDMRASAPHRRTYRSGDRVVWAGDGQLHFLGRVDEQIKLRGFRIEPGEVESALLSMPGIEEAAVVARVVGPRDTAGAEPGGHTQLVAFLRSAGTGFTVPPREQLEKRLPSFMVPSRYIEMPALPRLPNGKIDRQQLQTLRLENESPASGIQPPANDREHTLLSLWEGLLHRTGIGVTDNFFELGGHSLLVVTMTDAITRDHGVTLSPADLFQHPTVRELAQRIARQQPSEASPYAHLFPIQPAGQEMPFVVAIPHVFTEMLATRFRGERPVYGLRGVGLRPEGNVGRWPTMAALGEELVDEVCRRFPNETYIMAGYSFGATMAFDAVRRMEDRGLTVRRLYLIAPMPVDIYRIGPLRLQIGGLRKPIGDLSWREACRLFLRDNHPLTHRSYRRVWLLLGVRPWRRLLCLVGRLRRAVGLPLTPKILYADVRVERFRLHSNYRPRPIRTPTVIFNAVEPETDAAATWRPYFEGPLTVHEIPDPHLGNASVELAKDLILRHLTSLEDER